MNAYLLCGLNAQQHLAPMVMVNAESIEAAAAKLAGTVVEKYDMKYKTYLQTNLEFGRLVPSIETGDIYMSMSNMSWISGKGGLFSKMLARQYPILLLVKLRQI